MGKIDLFNPESEDWTTIFFQIKLQQTKHVFPLSVAIKLTPS